MELKLCLADLGSAFKIWEMQKKAFLPLYRRYRDENNPAVEAVEETERRLSQEERYYYLICFGHDCIGAISVKDRHDGSAKWLGPFFILPEYQGRGYGGKVIELVEELHGDKHWELVTIFQEKKLIHLYEKAGYKRHGEFLKIDKSMSLVKYIKA